MPWTGPTFELLYDLRADASAGPPASLIDADRVMDILEDITQALGGLLRADGTAPLTGKLDANNYTIKNLLQSGVLTEAATVKQATGGGSWAGTFGGTEDEIEATVALAPAAYAGMRLTGIFTGANTGPVTLSYNADIALPLQDMNGNELPVGYTADGLCAEIIRTADAWRVVSSGFGENILTVATDQTMSGNGGGVPLTGIVASEVVAYAGAVELDFAPATKSPYKTITLTGNTVLTATNLTPGEVIVIRLVQDATGSREVTWGAMFDFGATSPIINSVPNSTTMVAGLVRAADKIDIGIVQGATLNASAVKGVYATRINQSIPVTTETIITTYTAVAETITGFDDATGVFTAPISAWYTISASAVCSITVAATTQESASMSVHINGSYAFGDRSYTYSGTGTTSELRMNASQSLFLAAGATVDVRGNHTGGATQNYSCNFSIVQLLPT